ncbi:hypothetical protein T484DRAFT_1826316 [Baffinella frigidus]|nr:hypothetical protein T484DRAFT_1826316 [Cryptophyta sp. CCMP2293]
MGSLAMQQSSISPVTAPAISVKLLPRHLQERTRVAKVATVATSSEAPEGQFILYVMRKVLRGHENPALDAAIEAANLTHLPLLVLLLVEDRYPNATARRQTFLLQGAAAAVEELRAQGLQVAVHVSRAGHRQQAAFSLAHRARLVVAEEPFCAPWLAGCRALCSKSFAAPVWLVDADSIVPCALVNPAACHKAYKYEAATKAAAAVRLAAPWVDAVLHARADTLTHACAANAASTAVPALIALPFEPVLDLSADAIARLVAEMDAIDHAVPAVTHTLGGSVEGYRRWDAFVARGGLNSYAARRNDSLDPSGVSRMSAFLNLGMVSPLRIGREVRTVARNRTCAGAAKFTAEFETWRGLSYAFCYHHTPPGAVGATVEMLPAWAQATLAKHARDPRSRLVPLSGP